MTMELVVFFCLTWAMIGGLLLYCNGLSYQIKALQKSQEGK